MLRWHHADHDLRPSESPRKIVAGGHRVRDAAPGKKPLIDALLRDRFADVVFMRPQADAVRAFASQHNGDAGSPRPSADDCDLAHFSWCALKRLSVPASKRWMLAWC